MNEVTRVEDYLARIAAGDRSLISPLLELLSNQILFAPVTLFIDVQDARGTKKARVVTIRYEDRRAIPVFTSEDYFLDWAEGKFQCLPIRGADLALTLPEGTGFFLNMNLASSVELDSDDLGSLFDEDIFEDTAEEIERTPEPIRAAGDPSEPRIDFDVVVGEIATLLKLYPEVLEGYFVEHKGEFSEAVLGLLAQDLSVERRFVLITEVGEIARAHFGYAGAIETYTDLHAPHSSSWELFRLESPFFVRESDASAPSYGKREGIVSKADGTWYERANPQSTSEQESLEKDATVWEKVRKKRSWFFRNHTH